MAQQKNTLQVTKNTTLPNDIESMYWINVKFVAPSNENLELIITRIPLADFFQNHRYKIVLFFLFQTVFYLHLWLFLPLVTIQ